MAAISLRIDDRVNKLHKLDAFITSKGHKHNLHLSTDYATLHKVTSLKLAT